MLVAQSLHEIANQLGRVEALTIRTSTRDDQRLESETEYVRPLFFMLRGSLDTVSDPLSASAIGPILLVEEHPGMIAVAAPVLATVWILCLEAIASTTLITPRPPSAAQGPRPTPTTALVLSRS